MTDPIDTTTRHLATDQTSSAGAAPLSAVRLARTAGTFYLAVAILGGFAHGYVRRRVYAPGDATTTADNIVASAGLVRIDFAADLVQATLMLFVVMMLYRLLEHVNRGVAQAMVIFVVVSVSITCLNMVFQLGALLVATEHSYSSAFGADASKAVVLLLLDLQHNGYLVAQIFFGLWLFPVGLLVFRSGMFPRPLGILLMAGAVSYLIDVALQFLAPDVAKVASPTILVPLVIVAEVAMLLYLLLRGVRRADRTA